MSSALNPAQFPVYEIGDPEHHAPERGYHSTRYGPEHEISPEAFGFRISPHPWTQGMTFKRTKPEMQDIPLHKVDVTQHYVYGPHVQNLANLPQHVFSEVDSFDPVVAEHLPGGRFLVPEGHHRTVAAKVRGDRTIRVQLRGRWQ